VANDDLSEWSVLILHGETDLLYGKRPIFPSPRPQTRLRNPHEGQKPQRSPRPPTGHPKESSAKRQPARFFWFFCGVKKGPPRHRKIDATTEKWALRLREEEVIKIRKSEAIRGDRLPTCLLQEL
jgi:hypothetical protein